MTDVEDSVFGTPLYTRVTRRLTEIDPRLVPHPLQIGMFEGHAAVGAALLAAVGSHAISEALYEGSRIERHCESCPGRPEYPCPELREVTRALGIEPVDD